MSELTSTMFWLAVNVGFLSAEVALLAMHWRTM